MMLFKLSLGNIRRSLKDYTIYFFTLVIGVSVFYVFNTIGDQAAMMKLSESRYAIIALLDNMLSGVSVFVACVLGLLIVYASRFLMKRRNREFAIYMMLGMSKWRISAILLLETMTVGVFSLAAGLMIGIGLSQVMSALVANLFEADMTAYRFIVSGDAVIKTAVYFAVMYLVVILFNNLIISKMKLLDLMQSGKKSEHIKLKNPVICGIVFVIAAVALGYAYYQVGWRYTELGGRGMMICIAVGAASTFFIFWSVSGIMLRAVMRMKRVYFRGLNAFTFRQVSSKINTMVFSMTVICLMLFVTICALSAALSIRNSMNANLTRLCPADFEIEYREYADGDRTRPVYGDVTELFSRYGYDIKENFSEHTHFHRYIDPEFTFGSFLGDRLDEIMAQYNFLLYNNPFDIYRLSDYNELMRLYGGEELTLSDNEYILVCNFRSMKELLDDILEEGYGISLWGHELVSRYDECQDGYVDLATQSINAGLFVVPDEIPEDTFAGGDYFIGNYDARGAEELHEAERRVRSAADDVLSRANAESGSNLIAFTVNTKIDIYDAATGLGAIVAFLGLYIGLVFLIVCGAVLALKELSESVDSTGRYEMLRRIGADESDINKSLFRQTGLFFLFPLLLACIHSVFGLKFAVTVLEIFGTEKTGISVLITSLIILLIYGGYFLVTFYSGRQIIKDRNG